MLRNQRIVGVKGGLRTQAQRPGQRSAFTAKRHNVLADLSGGLAGTTPSSGGMPLGSVNVSPISYNNAFGSELQYYMSGVLPMAMPQVTDATALIPFYRDMYLFDSIAGAAVDINATFPFSDFDLRGLDRQDLKPFWDNLERLNIRRMMPEIATSYLTDGHFTGSLIFDGERNQFIDTMVHDAQMCNIQDTPMYNAGPEIIVQVPQQLLALMSDDGAYISRYLQGLPPNFINLLQSGQFRLDPVATLYLPRKTLADRPFVSYLHRLLPMYLIEKALFRGTLIEAHRRQRAMTQVRMGDDLWTPENEEMVSIMEQFMAAESDPTGGWVATRNAVDTVDLRCLSGRTRVSTGTGLVRIKDMVPHDPSQLEDGHEVELDNVYARNHLGKYAKVHSWIYQGKKQTYELTTSDGSVTYPTLNHRYLTVGDSADLQLVKVSSLKGRWLLRNNEDEVQNPSKSIKGVPADVIVQELLRRDVTPRNYKQDGVRGSLLLDDEEQATFIPGDWQALFGHFVPSQKGVRSYFLYDTFDSGGYDEHLKFIGKVSPSFLARVVTLFKHRYEFVEITSLVPHKIEHVYDLHMCEKSGPPTFYADGFATKNSAGDFWKWTDMVDQMVQYKLRALGISEAFLSGDASFAASESAYSTFLESCDSFRENLTHRVFTQKLFPLIALANGLWAEDATEEDKKADAASFLFNSTARNALKIPHLMWDKPLHAETEIDLMSRLEMLDERGVPVPIKMWMTAADVDSDVLLRELEEDKVLRDRLAEFTGKDTSYDQDGDDDELDAMVYSLMSHTRRKPLLARKFGDPEITETNRSGSGKKWVYDQKAANERANRNIARARIAMRDANHRRAVANRNRRLSGSSKLKGF